MWTDNFDAWAVADKLVELSEGNTKNVCLTFDGNEELTAAARKEEGTIKYALSDIMSKQIVQVGSRGIFFVLTDTDYVSMADEGFVVVIEPKETDCVQRSLSEIQGESTHPAIYKTRFHGGVFGWASSIPAP